jgi:prepilin-type processing-associated H-X9-DG protein/prepilin-type N-terminal cleavage/methylation domain-containing protein
MFRRAFTLIELVVVIAVIAILASMLMPATVMARRRARDIDCRSRLKNIGWAVRMYGSDHESRLPPMADHTGTQFFGHYSGPDEPVDFRRGFLSRYVADERDIWQCPSFRKGDQFLPRADGPTSGYAYNYHYLTRYKDNFDEVGSWTDPNFWWAYAGREEGIIKKSTTTALFGDSARNYMGPLQENWFWTPPSQAIPWGSAYTHFRHMGRANVLWADGHVSTLKPDDTVEVDDDYLGVICDTTDFYFDPEL